jgi:hypothetical protein
MREAITIIAVTLFGLIVLSGLYVLWKNSHCYNLSCRIARKILYYRCITGNTDIDYNLDIYLDGQKYLNPFIWTERAMCKDKEKYDKLNQFVQDNPEAIEELKITLNLD